jgi:hypothetical protein
MYNDREERLFQLNAHKCPCRINNGSTVPGCTLSKPDGRKGCYDAAGCPIYYWLKVTGLLQGATFAMELHPVHGPDGMRQPGSRG